MTNISVDVYILSQRDLDRREQDAFRRGNFDRRALFDFLESSGYAIHTFGDFLFDKGPLGYDEFRKCGAYPFRAFNFLAVPN